MREPTPNVAVIALVACLGATASIGLVTRLSAASPLPGTGLASLAGAQADFSHSPCTAPEARAFDFWHGDWNVNNRWLPEEGGWVEAGSAEVKVYPVLDGCITIEHWEGNLGANRIIGFSARAWDERKAAWVLLLNWPSTNRATFGTLEGRFRHGRGEFFSRYESDGGPVNQRYSFSDIGASSFRWDQAYSTDGQRWRSNWIMEYSRRDPTRELPVMVGPTSDNSVCDGEPYRQFDALTGDWNVTTEIPRSDGTSYTQTGTMKVIPILRGCALMDVFEAISAEGETFKTFRVRSYDGQIGRWVTYWYDIYDRAFQRFEGALVDGTAVFESRPEWAEGRIDRMIWRTLTPDAATWVFEMSRDGGQTWGRHAAATFTR